MPDDSRITALRAAAAKLSEALAASGHETALDHIDDACHLLGDDTPEADVMWSLESFNVYDDSPAGWRWLVGAAQLRLMVEAVLLEQEARQERVGGGYRDCLREDDGTCCSCRAAPGELHQGMCDWERCGKCHDQRMSCGCDVEEIDTLVRAWREGVPHGE